jgi:hypothetical protein
MLLVAGLLAGLTFEKRMPAPAALERAAPSRAAPAPAAEDASEPGRLAIDFDHHLRSGNLRVWVDDEEVLDQGFGGKVTKKILSLQIRKGSVDEVVAVKPGRHDVKVQVQWDDNTRTDSIAGTFRPGATRTLEIRILRVVNVMTLGWR